MPERKTPPGISSTEKRNVKHRTQICVEHQSTAQVPRRAEE